jgi:multicomponent Na+:H+ antiporter subunit G
MPETFIEWIGATLLAIGSVFSVIGAIGLLRFPDFYTRMHAAGITDTMGAWTLLVGMMCYGGWSLVTAKLAMILFFLFITGPAATHALSKTAWYAGVKPQLAPPPAKTDEAPPSKP